MNDHKACPFTDKVVGSRVVIEWQGLGLRFLESVEAVVSGGNVTKFAQYTSKC